MGAAIPSLPGPSEERMLVIAPLFGRWLKLVSVAVFTVLAIFVVDGAMLAVVLGLGVAIVAWYAWRLRGGGANVAVGVELALAASVGLTQADLGPGEAWGWPFRTAFILAVGAHCEWPRNPVAWAITGVTAVSVGVGAWLGSGSPDDAFGAGFLLIQLSLAGIVLALLRSVTRNVDKVGARVAEERRRADIAAARRAVEREQFAILHDTACTTLLMVSNGAAADNADWLPQRARRDLDMLTEQWHPASGVVDLGRLLDSVAGDAEIEIDVDLSSPLPLPWPVATAVTNGVREAVHNVGQHSRTSSATLRAGRDAGDTWIELTDDGVGFDAATVPEHCRGISDSIIGRMVAVGGTATVTSVPGKGTTVRWRCR